jgi:hypothetical protein
MHSSGTPSFDERLLKYPKKCLHSVLSGIGWASCFSFAKTLHLISISSSGVFVSAGMRTGFSTTISVKQ